MGIIKALLRAFSYIFEGLLALFICGISVIAVSSDAPLHLDFLPWTGLSLAKWLFALGLCGLLALALAVTGKTRILFFLWAATVFVLLVRGFFLTSYRFSGPIAFKPAVWLTLAALVGALGALSGPRKPNPMRHPLKY